jgi:putative transposase
MRYWRADVKSGTDFFTVEFAEWKRTSFVDHIDVLRTVMKKVKDMHPFQIDAMVILPDHLHAVWTLPEADDDFFTRWRMFFLAESGEGE